VIYTYLSLTAVDFLKSRHELNSLNFMNKTLEFPDTADVIFDSEHLREVACSNAKYRTFRLGW
jgi:hypothetical protein